MARPKKVVASSYKVTLEANGEVYKSNGTSLLDALNGFAMDYTQLKTKGTITVEKDGKKSSKFFYLPQLRRIIASKFRKQQVVRDLEFLLK